MFHDYYYNYMSGPMPDLKENKITHYCYYHQWPETNWETGEERFSFGSGTVQTKANQKLKLRQLAKNVFTNNSYLPYVEYRLPDPETDIPALTTSLLGNSEISSDCDIATNNYCYFERDGVSLYYWPISGYIEWRNRDFNVGFPVNTEPDESKTNLETLKERALVFLKANNLIETSEGEEIKLNGTSKTVLNSMEKNTQIISTKVISLDLIFGRKINGMRVVGGGYAIVHIGADYEISGVDVLWRPISKVKKGKIRSAEKIYMGLMAKKQGIENETRTALAYLETERAEVVLRSLPRYSAQTRGLPYLLVPANINADASLKKLGYATQGFLSTRLSKRNDEGAVTFMEQPFVRDDEPYNLEKEDEETRRNFP